MDLSLGISFKGEKKNKGTQGLSCNSKVIFALIPRNPFISFMLPNPSASLPADAQGSGAVPSMQLHKPVNHLMSINYEKNRTMLFIKIGTVLEQIHPFLDQTSSGSLMCNYLIRGQRYQKLLMRASMINAILFHHKAKPDGIGYLRHNHFIE